MPAGIPQFLIFLLIIRERGCPNLWLQDGPKTKNHCFRVKRLPDKRISVLHGAEILQQAALLFHPLNNSGDCLTTTIRNAMIVVIE